MFRNFFSTPPTVVFISLQARQQTRTHTNFTNRPFLCSDGTEPAETKETEKALVIPEKASSFRIHPDKLCQDQCFYCGGKFGLFDTPCHVAGIKSEERRLKILGSKY